VIAKAEQIEGKENPRYLVTSLSQEAWPAQKLYEQLYCARGEMENRIKEQLSLFADRMSTETLRANQLRLYFSSLAYGAGRGLAAVGVGGHGVGGSPSRHHPAEAAENRRAGAHHRAPHLGSLQLRLSLAARFRRCLDGAALLNKRQKQNLVSHSQK
jgi:Transposase DDE domain group 1